jgi:hypothetical protein
MTRKNGKTILVLASVTMAVLVTLDCRSRATATQNDGEQRLVSSNNEQTKKEKKTKKSPLSVFMRAKLAASSQVLEGLCTEDYALITKGAKRLHSVSHAEKWRVSNDAMYRQHSAEFRSDVSKLLKAAEQKKLDSAALAWTKTTLNCIECHRWVNATLISKK